jgi:hypothetical protein
MQINKNTTDQLELAGIEKESLFIDSVFDLTPDDVERLKTKKPKSLGMVCRRSDCKRDLHCFDSSASKLEFAAGHCQSCGVDLIDWKCVHGADLQNVAEKFEYLKKEWIRHFFFHVPITVRIESYARRQGARGLAEVLDHHFRRGKMLRFNSDFDWQQTQMLRGTIVHWARHATASCCRACMKYWHNIPLDHELTHANIEYFKELAMRYINLRIPALDIMPMKKAGK